MATTQHTGTTSTPATKPIARLFAPLVGVTTLVILAQGLMAGVFLQTDGKRDAYSTWISAHGVGADAAWGLALITAIVAFVGLRARRDLVIGSAVLFVLLLGETALGHLVNGSIGGKDHDRLTIIHIPLGMALIGLAVWLAARAAQLRRAGTY